MPACFDLEVIYSTLHTRNVIYISYFISCVDDVMMWSISRGFPEIVLSCSAWFCIKTRVNLASLHVRQSFYCIVSGFGPFKCSTLISRTHSSIEISLRHVCLCYVVSSRCGCWVCVSESMISFVREYVSVHQDQWSDFHLNILVFSVRSLRQWMHSNQDGTLKYRQTCGQGKLCLFKSRRSSTMNVPSFNM